MNAGAYDHEEEVLLYDGVMLTVISVTELKDEDGKTLFTLISLKTSSLNNCSSSSSLKTS